LLLALDVGKQACPGLPCRELALELVADIPGQLTGVQSKATFESRLSAPVPSGTSEDDPLVVVVKRGTDTFMSEGGWLLHVRCQIYLSAFGLKSHCGLSGIEARGLPAIDLNGS
jgi:hypothetical protein